MKSAQMLIADAERTVAAHLLLNFKAPLLRVSILQVLVHCGEIHQHSGWQRGTREDVREHRSPCLRGRKSDTQLACARYGRRIAAGEEGIGHGAQRYAVVKEAKAAT